MDATYQERVGRHVAVVTEGDPTDMSERRDRFGEESLELQQAFGQTRAEAHALVDYVHGRPVGEPGAEMGGVLYTVAALANQARLDMVACGEHELAQLSTPEATAKIRRKRAARHGRGALPGRDPAEASAGDVRTKFAEGALARAAGSPKDANPYADGLPRQFWEAGWTACELLPGT